MRKILYISGTRADYGLMRETLFRIKKEPKLEVEIAVTGMHLMPEFGRTIGEIIKDRFKIHKVKATYREDNKKSMAGFTGQFILRLTERSELIKPDIILVLGDRAEMLAGAIVGAYLMIPVAHIHGGDVSSTVDEISRHAITKLSHIHLVATAKSAQRIIKMGEDRWRVHIVGAPGLDSILQEKPFSKKEIAKKYNLDLTKDVLLVIQHPVTGEISNVGSQMAETMEAIKELKKQSIVIYPNADAGARRIINIIEKYRRCPFIKIYKSIPRQDYLSLMRISAVMVGNSSSGIIEAPSFNLPAVNIGIRQDGRQRAENILDVDYNRNQIKQAIQKALYDKKFKNKVKRCISPYGDGRASERITQVLRKIKIDNKLLQKKIAY